MARSFINHKMAVMKVYSLLLLLLIGCTGSIVQAQQKKPVPIIFDTDMGPDYDDVGAPLPCSMPWQIAVRPTYWLPSPVPSMQRWLPH
jgi:hypothetical protein